MEKFNILIRFDDLCPTMNWKIWEEVVNICFLNNIKPIIAVIPDNKDDNLNICENRDDFWEHIKMLQEKGFTVGLHGFQHLYTTSKSGILGIQKRSEFAGIPLYKQKEMIKTGVEIFKRYGITPTLWVAPSHSFDANTLKALKDHNISVISDGFFRQQVIYKGFTWIPCKHWRMPESYGGGLWTCCFHFNNWTEHDIDRFRQYAEKYKDCFVSANESFIKSSSGVGLKNFMLHHYSIYKFRLKRMKRRVI